jgi:hypothetical protein
MHHAQSSVRNWGGKVSDYYATHAWFDESKAHFIDPRHRALRHHTEGIAMCIEMMGPTITLDNGLQIPRRWVGEQHVREDLGWIPTLKDWFQHIVPQKWMNTPLRLSKTLSIPCTPDPRPSDSPTTGSSGEQTSNPSPSQCTMNASSTTSPVPAENPARSAS